MKQIIANVLVALPILLNAQQACEPTADLNQDGVVGISDLLNLLSAFGDTDLDFDGIYDSVDDCVGAYDECGVCNGDGAPCPCQGPGVYDGYEYAVIEIGEQCWFSETLRSVTYSNGDSLDIGVATIYGEGSAPCSEMPGWNACDDQEVSLALYGRLYNWQAAADGRGICPSGWHTPSDDDWMILETFLGMSESDLLSWGHVRGVDVQAAEAMKSTTGWYANGNGTDEHGFTALPGGMYNQGDYFVQAGDYGRWWSSTEFNIANGIIRSIARDASGIARDPHNFSAGFSIRCLKD